MNTTISYQWYWFKTVGRDIIYCLSCRHTNQIFTSVTRLYDPYHVIIWPIYNQYLFSSSCILYHALCFNSTDSAASYSLPKKIWEIYISFACVGCILLLRWLVISIKKMSSLSQNRVLIWQLMPNSGYKRENEAKEALCVVSFYS